MGNRVETPDNLLKTIEAIVRSPLLEEYNIGITVDLPRRKGQYRTWGPRNNAPSWQHFVVLNTRPLQASKALELEQDLYNLITNDRRSVLYRKYRGDTKHKPHTKSLGGLTDDNERPYYIYVAWGNVGDN